MTTHPGGEIILYPTDTAFGARELLIYGGSALGAWFGYDFAVAAPSVWDGAAAVIGQLPGRPGAAPATAAAVTAALSRFRDVRDKGDGNASEIAALKQLVSTLQLVTDIQGAEILKARQRIHDLSDGQQMNTIRLDLAELEAPKALAVASAATAAALVMATAATAAADLKRHPEAHTP